jgi:predicted O-methyltransferase YrrM
MKKDNPSLAPEMSKEETDLVRSEVKSAPAKGRILEIGTSTGGTLIEILKALPQEERPRVSVIDRFKYFPGHLGIFKGNLSKNGFDPEQVDIRVGTSSDELRKCIRGKEGSFSFIVIDTSHQLKHAMEDMRWLGLLTVGGKAAVHDYYSAKFPGVKIAVDRFLARNGNYKVRAQANTLVILEKTAATTKREVTPLDLLFAYTYSIILNNRRGFKRTLGRLTPFGGK